jgi:hypothetical protein
MDDILKRCTLKYPIGTIILKGNNTYKITAKPIISESSPSRITCEIDNAYHISVYEDDKYAEILSVPGPAKSNDNMSMDDRRVEDVEGNTYYFVIETQEL